MHRVAALLLLSFIVSASFAGTTVLHTFTDEAKQARYKNLVTTLRCVVCQNQNLEESNADIANDLKEKIYQSVQDGSSDKEIIQNLRQRYGDFILFSPPIEAKTFALWFGPLIIFLLGAFVIFNLVGQRRDPI